MQDPLIGQESLQKVQVAARMNGELSHETWYFLLEKNDFGILRYANCGRRGPWENIPTIPISKISRILLLGLLSRHPDRHKPKWV